MVLHIIFQSLQLQNWTEEWKMAAMQKHKIHEPQRIKISTLSYQKYRSSILYLHHYTVLFIYITIQYSWFSQKMSFCLFTIETFFFSTRAEQPSTIKEKNIKTQKRMNQSNVRIKEKWKMETSIIPHDPHK